MARRRPRYRENLPRARLRGGWLRSTRGGREVYRTPTCPFNRGRWLRSRVLHVSICASAFSSILCLVLIVERPDIVSEREHVGGRKLRAAHRRHGAAVILGIGHAVGDGLCDRRNTAVAPQPMLAGQVRSKRRALGVRAVAAGAGGSVLAVENFFAQGHLCFGLSRGRWKIGSSFHACVGMDSFGRLRLAAGRSSGLIFGGGRWGGLDCRGFDVAVESYAPDTAVLVI